MSYLSVNAVTAGYGKQNVIECISFNLESGSLMGIIGANGSGKTTLLNLLSGRNKNYTGEIKYDNWYLLTILSDIVRKIDADYQKRKRK